MTRPISHIVRAQRPSAVRVRALRQHTHLGRRYHTGDVYKRALRLAAEALDVGDVELVDVAGDQYDWYGTPGRILLAESGEAAPMATAPTPESLRILSGCGYDPGSAAYRYHSAVNECSPHASAFVRWSDTNPHCSLRQLDLRSDWALARAAAESADVLHCHVDYALLTQLGYKVRRRAGQVIVRHYHGSREHGTPHPVAGAEIDDELDAVLFGARLQLAEHRETGRIHWLPIPMPVERYAAMRTTGDYEGESRPFRIAHSPTVRAIKGTRDLQHAVAHLQRQGLAVELVLIENMRHPEALARKATCDAVFDSFWLGIQGSGLEGAAMGLPVIAGDENVRDQYERSEVGHCPYTFAGHAAELRQVIERLVTDHEWRRVETRRAVDYVRAYHDYSAVAARYSRILASEMAARNLTPTLSEVAA